MYRIGVDIGGTKIAYAIVDNEGAIIEKRSFPTRAKERDADSIVDELSENCKKLLKDNNLTAEDICFMGIGAPGVCNTGTGYLEYVNSIPFREYPICSEIKKRLPVKTVMIANDANCAAKGEVIAGAAKGVKDAIMVTLGTGVGGGIIMNGKICAGFNYTGGELGHNGIVYNGRPCSCGRKGCWEAYSSATGLILSTKEKMETCPDSKMWELVEGDITKVNGRTAFLAARAGDKAGKEVVDEFINILAYGVTNMINIFQPEKLIIGGGLSNEGDDMLLNPLKKKVDEDQYAAVVTKRKKPELVKAILKNDAGIIGAAFLND